MSSLYHLYRLDTFPIFTIKDVDHISNVVSIHSPAQCPKEPWSIPSKLLGVVSFLNHLVVCKFKEDVSPSKQSDLVNVLKKPSPQWNKLKCLGSILTTGGSAKF